jgi:hypothetical protein
VRLAPRQRNVKLNLGVITGSALPNVVWPTKCPDPTDRYHRCK